MRVILLWDNLMWDNLLWDVFLLHNLLENKVIKSLGAPH